MSERGDAAPGRRLVALAVFLLGVAGVASFAGRFRPGAWYGALVKPPLNPPDWLFAPVWTLLYAGMAVAGWLVWCAPGRRTGPLLLWGTQLLLNALWSLLFFGLHRTGLALVEILVLLALVVATCVAFFRVSALAGSLLVPYAAWVGFAAYLNAGLWWLNRG